MVDWIKEWEAHLTGLKCSLLTRQNLRRESEPIMARKKADESFDLMSTDESCIVDRH